MDCSTKGSCQRMVLGDSVSDHPSTRSTETFLLQLQAYDQQELLTTSTYSLSREQVSKSASLGAFSFPTSSIC